MSDDRWTDYLDGTGYTLPSGNDVDVFISGILREQTFGTVIELEVTRQLIQLQSIAWPLISLQSLVRPGELNFTLVRPAIEFVVHAPLPELLSTMGSYAIWKDDDAGIYPEASQGNGWWSDATGFIITGDFGTLQISTWL